MKKYDSRQSSIGQSLPIGILKPIADYQNFPPFWNETSLTTNREPNYQNESYDFEHFLSVAKANEGFTGNRRQVKQFLKFLSNKAAN